MNNDEYWGQFFQESSEDTKTQGIVGTESFSSIEEQKHAPFSNTIGFFEADMRLAARRREMDYGSQRGGESVPLLIRTTDQKNYRIYFKADMFFDSRYLNKILCFLDSRTPGQTVTLVMGTKMDDYSAHNLGSVLTALQNCKADIFGVCAGYCSITETILWCFCKQRLMYRYGALTFGITDIVSTVPSYMYYFDRFFKKAQELNILTEEECEHLKSTGAEKMILYSEYFQRTNTKMN